MSVRILKLFGALKPPQVTFVYKVIYQLGAKRYLKPFDHPDQLKRDYLLAGSRVFLWKTNPLLSSSEWTWRLNRQEAVFLSLFYQPPPSILQVTTNGNRTEIAPPKPLPLWIVFLMPTILLAAIGFQDRSAWIIGAVLLLFLFGIYRLYMYFLPKYTVRIHHTERTIEWLQNEQVTQTVHLEEVAYWTETDYNQQKSALNMPGIRLHLQDGSSVQLTYFDSVWQRDKVKRILQLENSVVKHSGNGKR